MTIAAVAALAVNVTALLDKLVLEKRDPTPAEWESLKASIASKEAEWAALAPGK